MVSCWGVVSEKTGSSFALPVDSMFTSIGFVGMSSLIFKIFLTFGSICERDRKVCCGVHFSWNVSNNKIKLQYKIAGFPEGWRNHLCLKESSD